MKRIIFLLLSACCMAGFLASCSSDDEVRLQISNLVVGEGHSKTVVVGDTLLVQAAVIADAGIQNIRVSISPIESEGIPWTYDALYVTNYSDKTVATFSDLIPFAQEAAPGSYLFTMVLTDDTGNQVSKEETVTVQAATD